MNEFSNYESNVISDYLKKRESGTLLSALIRPTPAGLKKACLAVCDKRYDRKDSKFLTEFFGQHVDQLTCSKVIRQIDRDRFKPLIKLMKERHSVRDYNNVELLAWLIDFQPRPFELGRKYDVVPVFEPPFTTIEIIPLTDSGKPYSGLKFNIGIAAATLVILTCMVAFLSTGRSSGPQACMYWTGDHYEKIDCNQKTNALTIALDSEKLIHFRKITRTDTITFRSKGYVWYSKINNKLEFFTSSGNHPTEIYNTLRPISDYIIKKYCLQTQ